MRSIRTRNSWLMPLLLLALAALGGCGGTSDSSAGDGGGDTKLTLVAYSTPEEAYKELIPAFNKTSAGKGVSFDQSYAASGEQSRAVEGGLPADVVEFSLEPDMTRLVDAGLVDKGWNQNKYDGFVTNSIVVLVTRKGNPKNIKDWDDLTTGDVETLVPNPFTSGGAKWDIMAAYGAQLEQGKSDAQAQDYLKKLFETCRCSTRARANRSRRSRPARATSCSGTRTRRSSRSSRARTSTTSSPTRRS